MRHPGLLLAAALGLASCGGGRDSPEELTGRLQAGSVQGVAYRTDTRSGTTDAQGRFQYRAGEQISFLVGSVEIGRIAGAADISLFDLAGLTPPSDERALRRALDIATRSHSPFTRAMNIDLLLLALDADGNPANGLDVRGRRDALSGVTLDFDLPHHEFLRKLYRSVPDLTQNISRVLPVVHLYGSLGIKVPAHARREMRYESEGLDTVNTYTYYPNGALRSEELDLNADAITDTRYSYEYDAMLRITRYEGEADYDFDLIPESVYSVNREYDASGREVGGIQWQLLNVGQAVQWQLTDVTYDPFGRLRHQVVDVDDGADGGVDERETYDIEYDDRGNGTGVRWATDLGVDGVEDSVFQSIYQYDSNDRLLSRVEDGDTGADGVVDSRATWTYTYGLGPLPTGLVIATDANGDGANDQSQLYEWTYDAHGNILISAARLELTGVGGTLSSVVYTREYDAERRITRSERVESPGILAVFDGRQLDVIEYDDLGNQVQRISEFDEANDGVIDARVVEGAEFGTGGELLGSGSGFDWNGDGLSDAHTSVTVTSELFEDGVLHLAQWYFTQGTTYVDGGVVGL